MSKKLFSDCGLSWIALKYIIFQLLWECAAFPKQMELNWQPSRASKQSKQMLQKMRSKTGSAWYLTSCSSRCAVRPGQWSVACLLAHPGNQTCIWWPAGGRCRDGPYWTPSQKDRPQTSAVCPKNKTHESLQHALAKMSGVTSGVLRHYSHFIEKNANCEVLIDVF